MAAESGGRMINEEPATIRLFIGGLKPDVTAEMVEGRFKSFGTVESVDLRPAKSSSGIMEGSRGFGYVDFKPRDDKALSRCLSLYNGCTWKGQKLRLEKAKMSYLAKMELETEAEQESERELQRQREEQSQVDVQPPSIFERGNAESLMLRIEERLSKVSQVPLVPKHTPLTHKKYFPPMKSNLTAASLSWDVVVHEYTQREILQIAATPGPHFNPLSPDSDDEPQQEAHDAACSKQSTNASGGAVALRQQLPPSLLREDGRQDCSLSNPGRDQEPAIQDAAATANEAQSTVPRVDAPSIPQGRKLGNNAMPGGPGDAKQQSESARKAPAAKQQRQQPFSHGEAKREGQDMDVAGTKAGRAKRPMSTHSMAQQKKQHRGSLLRPEPEPEVEEDVQSSDSEDYSALRNAAATRSQRAPQRGSGGEGFEVVSAVRSKTPIQPSRKRQAERSAGSSRPESMRTPRGSKVPRNGPQMEGIDDSWLASIAMR